MAGWEWEVLELRGFALDSVPMMAEGSVLYYQIGRSIFEGRIIALN